ncbi:hypothetical protein PR048_002756 [Dryococelus australis]|uniref:Uncharacterized protein n=1 Tax=Dryococelus australis TaxID=614101 RepID=A0ABQ9IL21_9NEOP|nr:hypothetical protein PR048_002756 [Dryococelus australis]
MFANSFRDKIDVKHVYSEVTFAIGSQFIKHALDSEAIEDLQTRTEFHTANCGVTLVTLGINHTVTEECAMAAIYSKHNDQGGIKAAQLARNLGNYGSTANFNTVMKIRAIGVIGSSSALVKYDQLSASISCTLQCSLQRCFRNTSGNPLFRLDSVDYVLLISRVESDHNNETRPCITLMQRKTGNDSYLTSTPFKAAHYKSLHPDCFPLSGNPFPWVVHSNLGSVESIVPDSFLHAPSSFTACKFNIEINLITISDHTADEMRNNKGGRVCWLRIVGHMSSPSVAVIGERPLTYSNPRPRAKLIDEYQLSCKFTVIQLRVLRVVGKPGRSNSKRNFIPTLLHTRTGFDSRLGRLQDLHMREPCQTMPLVGGFSRGSPVFPALAFCRCSILFLISLSSALETSLLRAAQFSQLNSTLKSKKLKLLQIGVFDDRPANSEFFTPRGSHSSNQGHFQSHAQIIEIGCYYIKRAATSFHLGVLLYSVMLPWCCLVTKCEPTPMWCGSGSMDAVLRIKNSVNAVHYKNRFHSRPWKIELLELVAARIFWSSPPSARREVRRTFCAKVSSAKDTPAFTYHCETRAVDVLLCPRRFHTTARLLVCNTRCSAELTHPVRDGVMFGYPPVSFKIEMYPRQKLCDGNRIVMFDIRFHYERANDDWHSMRCGVLGTGYKYVESASVASMHHEGWRRTKMAESSKKPAHRSCPRPTTPFPYTGQERVSQRDALSKVIQPAIDPTPLLAKPLLDHAVPTPSLHRQPRTCLLSKNFRDS